MKRLFLQLFLILSAFSLAQTFTSNDAQLWFNLYLEKKINKKISVHLNQQDRLTDNISQFTFAYADVGITYKISKDIKVFADYVFTQKRANIQSSDYPDVFGTTHQYYIAFTIKKDFARWRFAYRAMYQFEYKNPFTSSSGLIAYHYDRNKFIIKYEYNKRLSFYVAEELYIPLNSPQISGIDRSRTFAGVFINTFKKQQLELYFMYQSRIQNGAWFKQHNSYKADNYILEQDFVYGIGYSFDF